MMNWSSGVCFSVRLRVVMCVQVDDAGAEDAARRIHRLGGAFRNIADRYDTAASDRHIRLDQRVAQAVRDRGAPDDQIMHRPSSSYFALPARSGRLTDFAAREQLEAP